MNFYSVLKNYHNVYVFYLKVRSLNGLKWDKEEKNYCKYYDVFMNLLKNYLKTEEQIGRIISMSAFEFLVYYYRELKNRPTDIEAQIIRKRFFLSGYDGQMDSVFCLLMNYYNAKDFLYRIYKKLNFN